MDKQEFTDNKQGFESLSAKLAKQGALNQKLKTQLEKLATQLEQIGQNGEPGVMILPKKGPTVSVAERYKVAWKRIYDEQKEWRKKEIDISLKDGSFGVKDWDTDFVRQVTSLAESDDPLEV